MLIPCVACAVRDPCHARVLWGNGHYAGRWRCSRRLLGRGGVWATRWRGSRADRASLSNGQHRPWKGSRGAAAVVRSLRGARRVPSATATAKAKARAVRACGDPDSVTALVGLVSESREDHLKRHSGGIRGCPRCRWYTFGHAWAGTYGSLNTQELRAGPRERVVWIAERPFRWSGTWGLGCTLAA